MDSQKREIIDATVKQLQKKYGDGAIMRLEEKNKLNIDVIPTGILSLDIATGVGGFARGRIVEIYGPESSGKTTIALSAIAEVQKRGGVAAFIDAEHALDPVYAQKIGVNLTELYVSQPDSGEQALEIAEQLVRTNQIDLIVIDSVAALVPRAEIEGSMGDSQIGLQARLMSQALRKITGAVNKSKTCVVFINQLRMKIGGYGNPETTTGGMALKFYASLRIEVRKGEALKEKEDIYGYITKIKIAKNKLASPFKTAEFLVLFAKGPYNIACVVEEATKIDVIKRNGTFYYYEDKKLGQGKEAVYQFLEQNPEILREIEKQVRLKHNLPVEEITKIESPEEKIENKTKNKRSKKTDLEEELL